MHRLTRGLCLLGLGLAVRVQADLVQLADGTNVEGRVLGLFNHRFEFADKDGQITHPALAEVKRIQFNSPAATIVTADRKAFHGQLVLLDEGLFTLVKSTGARQQIAADQVRDLTVTGRGGNSPAPLPPPPAAKPKPVAAAAPPAAGATAASPVPGKITIVDFYADWCGPCKRIGPVLDDIAQHDPQVTLRRINVDQNGELAQRYHVTGIPHILVYNPAGEEVDTIVGADPQRVAQAVAKAKRGE